MRRFTQIYQLKFQPKSNNDESIAHHHHGQTGNRRRGLAQPLREVAIRLKIIIQYQQRVSQNCFHLNNRHSFQLVASRDKGHSSCYSNEGNDSMQEGNRVLQ